MEAKFGPKDKQPPPAEKEAMAAVMTPPAPVAEAPVAPPVATEAPKTADASPAHHYGEGPEHHRNMALCFAGLIVTTLADPKFPAGGDTLGYLESLTEHIKALAAKKG
jgi:hypothetical protein